jgi:hypothetical protein
VVHELTLLGGQGGVGRGTFGPAHFGRIGGGTASDQQNEEEGGKCVFHS